MSQTLTSGTAKRVKDADFRIKLLKLDFKLAGQSELSSKRVTDTFTDTCNQWIDGTAG